MLYADDLALAEQTETGMQNRFGDWKRTLECKGLKVNINKTETIKDVAGNTLKQTETFKNLGSTFSAQGRCKHDARNRVKKAWRKWRKLTRVLCDNKMPIKIKGKVYKSMIRRVMMYGAEAWTLTRKEEELLERAEMRM